MQCTKYFIIYYYNSQIGRLRRPFPRPSGVGGIKAVGLLKCIKTDTHKWGRYTCGTDTHVGQTHIWDRHTYWTDTPMGQTHIAYEKQSSC